MPLSSTILHLPTELLEEIVSLVACNHPDDNLKALSLTCRRFLLLCQKKRYAVLSIWGKKRTRRPPAHICGFVRRVTYRSQSSLDYLHHFTSLKILHIFTLTVTRCLVHAVEQLSRLNLSKLRIESTMVHADVVSHHFGPLLLTHLCVSDPHVKGLEEWDWLARLVVATADTIQDLQLLHIQDMPPLWIDKLEGSFPRLVHLDFHSRRPLHVSPGNWAWFLRRCTNLQCLLLHNQGHIDPLDICVLPQLEEFTVHDEVAVNLVFKSLLRKLCLRKRDDLEEMLNRIGVQVVGQLPDNPTEYLPNISHTFLVEDAKIIYMSKVSSYMVSIAEAEYATFSGRCLEDQARTASSKWSFDP